MDSLNYSKIVKSLEDRGMMPIRVPSLEPMQEGLRRLSRHGNSHPLILNPSRTLLVAGTNGKGSVASTLEALLLSAGQRVGLYTSPHLIEPTERFRIQGCDISRSLFCQLHDHVAAQISDLTLSHFEMLTLMAALLFFSNHSKEPSLDWVILEVGLGGIWDATQAIPHQHCIITSLGFDHEALLGNTLEKIAFNKFGIIGHGNQVIYSPLPQEVIPLALQTQKQTQSKWTESVPYSFFVEPGPEPTFWIHTAWGKAQLALAGPRAAKNTATALTAFEQLGFSPTPHLSALKKVSLSGRMEKWPKSTSSSLNEQPIQQAPLYLSGDHNPQGIASLIELLPYYPRKHLYLLFGAAEDKNLDLMLEPLFRLENTSIALTETPYRSRPLAHYGKWIHQACIADPNPLSALAQLRQLSSPHDLIVVTGSLYLVGLIKSAKE